MENGMQMTLEECMPETFQKQIAGASDSLASFEELMFLQKKDIYQLKAYLSEIECLLTKEDGKQLPQLCRETTQESGMSTDLASCQLAQQQNTRIMSLAYPNQLSSNQSRDSMIAITPQWCCLMKNQTNTVKRSGGLSDAILLMGGEFADKIDREGEGLCLRSVIKNEENLNTDCQKQTYMGLTLKKGLAGSIMCAITNYTNTLVYSGNMHMENEYQEKHYACHEKRPNTFITDTCQEMAETTKKKQHQPVQQSFLVCALLHSDWENLCQLSIILKEIRNALLKEGNANKETPTLLESLTNRLKDIIVEDMFAENCISQQNLINTKQYITLALKKMNLTLQTGQSSTIVKTSLLQENSLDFKETVQACFSELCTLSDNSKKKIDPLTFSLRTLRICLALMEDGISPDCSLKWSRGGYDAEWQVLNSKDFGVPQNRERCFIIGHLRERSAAEIFPIKGTDRENSISIIGHRDGFRRNTQVFDQKGITEALDTGQEGGRGHHVALPCFVDLSYQGVELTEKARCLQARYNKGVSNHKAETSGVVIPVLTPDRAEKRQNGRRFKENGEPMFTLTSQDRHGIATSISPIGGVYTGVSPEFYRGVYEGCFRCLKASTHDSGVALKLQNIPVSMTRNVIESQINIAHCLNANDSRKFFGKNQRGNAVIKTLKLMAMQMKLKIIAPRSKVPKLRSKQGMCFKSFSDTRPGMFVKISDELTIYAVWYKKYQCYIAIRKLTPKECFRLQGWTDEYFEKAAFVNSDSQLYKQAGNGVTVNVIEAIAKQLKFA